MRKGRYLPYIAALWIVSFTVCSFIAFGVIYMIRSGGVYFESDAANVATVPDVLPVMQDAAVEQITSQEEIYKDLALRADDYIRIALGESACISTEPAESGEFLSSSEQIVYAHADGTVVGMSEGKVLVSVRTDGDTAGGDGVYRCVVTVHKSCPRSAVLDVPMILQGEDYPNGCESVSTVMALNYVGMPVTVDTFIDRYLDHGYFAFDEEKPWIKYGKSPWLFYNGDPADNSGTYCFAPVIEAAMKKFVDTEKYEIDVVYGKGLMQLCTDYIPRGIPVIVWETVDMVPSLISSPSGMTI